MCIIKKRVYSCYFYAGCYVQALIPPQESLQCGITSVAYDYADALAKAVLTSVPRCSDVNILVTLELKWIVL